MSVYSHHTLIWKECLDSLSAKLSESAVDAHGDCVGCFAGERCNIRRRQTLDEAIVQHLPVRLWHRI